jgi:tetratricopeptide (TPR) repeat protein
MGICLTRGRIGDAMAHARSALDAAKDFGNTAYEKEAHYYLASLHRISGNLPMALEEIELACRDYQQIGPWAIRPLQMKAVVLLDLGRTDDFSSLLDEMRRYIEKEHHPKLMRAWHYLNGYRELREKHGAKAVEHLWKAVSLLPPTIAKKQFDADGAQYWYALGQAYDLAESCVSAEESFLKVPPYWDERFASGDLYALSFYRAAKLQELCGRNPSLTAHEQTAKRSAALANYRKFLSLWGDADPMFAVTVGDARTRATALETEMAAAGSVPGR